MLIPDVVIQTVLKRRFPVVDDVFLKALGVANRLFAPDDTLGDKILEEFWEQLTRRKRRQISSNLTGNFSEALSSEARLALRAMIEAYYRVQDELYELPAVELRELYDADRATDRSAFDHIVEAKEVWAKHNLLEARTISPVWRTRARWTIEQGVALALGREPSLVSTDSLNLMIGREKSPFVKAYRNLLEDIELAITAGELETPLQPKEFAHWLEERQIALPEAARPAAYTNTGAELAAKCAELTAENEQLLAQAVSLETEISDLRSQLMKNLELVRDLREEASEGSHNRKVALYSIILGLAISRYGYDPNAERSKGVSQIVSALELSDYPMREGAVKEILKEAKRLLQG